MTQWPRPTPLAGSVPDWVPANAKIHIDFLGGTPQGRAWSNEAVVAVDTLLGSDNVNGFTYNAAKIIPGIGYKDEDAAGYPAFTGALFTTVIASSTLVLSAVLQDDEQYKLELGTSDFNHSIDLQASQTAGSSNVEIDTFANTDVTVSEIDQVSNVSGIVKVAANLKAAADTADCAFSMNGRTAISHSQANAWGLPFDYVGFYVLGAPVLQAITIYDPLPDTTGLSELSGFSASPGPAPITKQIMSLYGLRSGMVLQGCAQGFGR